MFKITHKELEQIRKALKSTKKELVSLKTKKEIEKAIKLIDNEYLNIK
jgi:ribosomal protein L29